MTKNWKSLEDHARAIASLRWSAICRPEHIDGVDFDGVVRVGADEIILIEVTKERSLDKVRADLAKVIPVRMRLLSQGINCRAFIVLELDPTNGMVEAGAVNHIAVCSMEQFQASFFDFSAYLHLRRQHQFGSAVDSKTGQNDPRSFIPVDYEMAGRREKSGSRQSISVEEISRKLVRRSTVVLTGDYGSGKSRCLREVFGLLSTQIKEAGGFPIAINLREHWSSSNALELLAGHLGNIGITGSFDNVIRLLNSGSLVLLLDGFDEIGSQTYDPRISDRKSLRRHAVRGVRDLIGRCKAGVLVTGRSHFFDSDAEMLESLGLSNRPGLVRAHVREAFTHQEGEAYLRMLGLDIKLPDWLPRKPLVFQLLAELDREEAEYVLRADFGEYQFWGAFLYAVCVRESRGVVDSISAETVRQVLLELAARSRYSTGFLGRLSPSEIDEAYQRVVGSTPDDTGRQLLARLCTLGRIEPESPDRQFVDDGFVDVLRAEELIVEVAGMGDRHIAKKWKQGLRMVGIIHAAGLVAMMDLRNSCFAYLRKYSACENSKLLGEVVSLLTVGTKERLDFQSLVLVASELPVLNLSEREIANLTLKDSEIGVLDLEMTAVRESHRVVIQDSIVDSAVGVSDLNGMPDWIRSTEVVSFERLSNARSIKDSGIGGAHKLLLAMIHKIFFQRGSGRQEAALLKGGYGKEYSPQIAERILKILISEEVIERVKGDDGWVFKPVRAVTDRMSRIRSELSLSKDEIWIRVGRLGE